MINEHPWVGANRRRKSCGRRRGGLLRNGLHGRDQQCLAHAGTTGETNNLNLGACKAKAGDTRSISFVESN